MVKSVIIFACLLAFVGTLLVGCAGLQTTSGVDVPTQVALHIMSPEDKTPKMAEGHLLSDLIAINASVDIVMGEVDR